MSGAGRAGALGRELRSAHVRAQALRFVRLFVIALGAQLAALGGAHLGRSATVGVLVGALEVAFRQWVPVVPWAVVAAGAQVQPTVPSVPPPGPGAATKSG